MKKNNVLFHQDNAPCHKSIAAMAKVHELHFELLLHQPYTLYLGSSDDCLCAELRRILQGKRFGSNEEVISETEAYFVANDKSFYKKGIELFKKRWNQWMTLEETILMNELEFCLKVVLLVRPGTYWVMCYGFK